MEETICFSKVDNSWVYHLHKLFFIINACCCVPAHFSCLAFAFPLRSVLQQLLVSITFPNFLDAGEFSSVSQIRRIVWVLFLSLNNINECALNSPNKTWWGLKRHEACRFPTVWLSWNFSETLNTCQEYVVSITVCLEEQLVHLQRVSCVRDAAYLTQTECGGVFVCGTLWEDKSNPKQH